MYYEQIMKKLEEYVEKMNLEDFSSQYWGDSYYHNVLCISEEGTIFIATLSNNEHLQKGIELYEFPNAQDLANTNDIPCYHDPHIDEMTDEEKENHDITEDYLEWCYEYFKEQVEEAIKNQDEEIKRIFPEKPRDESGQYVPEGKDSKMIRLDEKVTDLKRATIEYILSDYKITKENCYRLTKLLLLEKTKGKEKDEYVGENFKGILDGFCEQVEDDLPENIFELADRLEIQIAEWKRREE